VISYKRLKGYKQIKHIQSSKPSKKSNLYLSKYRKIIEKAAKNYGIETSLIRAIIHVESHFNPKAVSPKGAAGLMQLMPATAKHYGVTNVFDPSQNINAGVKYLQKLMRRYKKSQLQLVLAAYNAGEKAVAKYQGVPPYRETLNYISKVQKLQHRYSLEP